MDNFANEVDKLLQDTRREQEENEEGGSHGIRSDRSAKKEGYNTFAEGHYAKCNAKENSLAKPVAP